MSVVLAIGDWVLKDPTSLAHSVQTAGLVAATPSDAVLALGDISNDAGSAEDYVTVAETLDGIKSRLRPVPGNHDYLATTPLATAYFDYFGAAAGTRDKGWYSFDLDNNWHLIALNSNTDEGIGVDGASEQGLWLAADLAANAGKHIIAYWHHPVVGSTTYINEAMWKASGTFWHQLYAAGAEIILNGHIHMYERYARQDWQGNADPAGIRQFIVGTGYTTVAATETPANRETYMDGDKGSTLGCLRLTLGAYHYAWEYLRYPLWGYFEDAGSERLHAPSGVRVAGLEIAANTPLALETP